MHKWGMTAVPLSTAVHASLHVCSCCVHLWLCHLCVCEPADACLSIHTCRHMPCAVCRCSLWQKCVYTKQTTKQNNSCNVDLTVRVPSPTPIDLSLWNTPKWAWEHHYRLTHWAMDTIDTFTSDDMHESEEGDCSQQNKGISSLLHAWAHALLLYTNIGFTITFGCQL